MEGLRTVSLFGPFYLSTYSIILLWNYIVWFLVLKFKKKIHLIQMRINDVWDLFPMRNFYRLDGHYRDFIRYYNIVSSVCSKSCKSESIKVYKFKFWSSYIRASNQLLQNPTFAKQYPTRVQTNITWDFNHHI